MTEMMPASRFLTTEGLEDWRVVNDGGCAFYRTASFAESARFVQAIGDLPSAAAHPPAIDVRADGVTVRLITITDDYFGMSSDDVDVAREVTALARDHGLPPDTSRIQGFLVIPGAPDVAEVLPFWQAVLGYDRRPDSPDEDLVDPRDRGPAFWFESMDEPRADGGGAIHLAVWMPYEEAEARLAAALAAGGRIVRDEFAPSWWTLADAAGNEVDISTLQERD